MAISDYRGWTPHTFLSKGSFFQHVGLLYEVLTDHTSGKIFNPNDSRITITGENTGGGGGGGVAGRGVVSTLINDDGDLIVVYSDNTSQNAGRARGMDASQLLQSEHLVVTGATSLTQTTLPMDTNLPIVLVVNHMSYSNLEVEPAFSASGTTITWNSVDEGFGLNVSDDVVVTYFKVIA